MLDATPLAQPKDNQYATITVHYFPVVDGFQFPVLHQEVPSLRSKTSDMRIYTQYSPDSPTVLGKIEEALVNLMVADHVSSVTRLPDYRDRQVFTVTFLKSNKLLDMENQNNENFY